MPLPANIDSLTIAQIIAIAQGLTTVEAEALLTAIARRYPRLGRQQLALSGYSTEVSPLGLGTRPEWAALLRSGRCFGGVFGGSAVAAQLAQAQLWNPTGSGKRVLVYFARGSRGAGIADLEIIYQLDTVQVPIAGNIASQIASAQNLLAGGAAPASQVRGGAAAALPTGLMFTRAMTATETPTPGGVLAELPEGFGLSLSGNTVNVAAFMTIWWAEVVPTYL